MAEEELAKSGWWANRLRSFARLQRAEDDITVLYSTELERKAIAKPTEFAVKTDVIQSRLECTAAVSLMELRVKKGTKLPRSLAGAGLEDAAQMALIGETRVAGYNRQIGPTSGQRAAHELHAQAIHEFRHRAAIVLAKNAGEMNRMHADLSCNFFQSERFPKRFVKQF